MAANHGHPGHRPLWDARSLPQDGRNHADPHAGQDPAQQLHDPDDASIGYALRCLARRAQVLAAERDELQAQLAILTHKANPTLMRVVGVGPNVAATLLIAAGGNPERLRSDASFAALCGVAPVPASSGKHQQLDSAGAATGTQTSPCSTSRCPA